MRFRKKVVVVTGGASGIGEVMSRMFANEGATVVVTDINAPRGREVASELAETDGDGFFLEVNMADDAAVGQALDEVVERFGRLDVLVNNAGIGGQPGDDANAWWRLFKVDLFGVAWGTRHAVRIMKERSGGAIVNIGSHSGQYGCRTGPYGAAKAAAHTLMRYTALEHGPDRIRANAVLPGNIYTTIHDTARQQSIARYVDGDPHAFAVDPVGTQDSPESRAEVLADFQKRHPMGRLAEPEDIARSVLFLSSDDAIVVTGNEFMVTGGILPKRLEGRLLNAHATAEWPEVPAPPAGLVALMSRNDEVAAAISARLTRDDVTVVRAPAECAFDEAQAREWLVSLGPLAGVVFAMSPDPGGTLGSQDPDLWEQVFIENVRIPWVVGNLASQLVVPGGAVTIVADVAGTTGAGGSPAFAAAAAALSYSTDDLANLLRPDAIRVNSVLGEFITSPTAEPGLGASASASDLAEMVVVLSRGLEAVSGSRVVLATAHP